MLLTPHALVGAAIGASTDNLVYIIVLAFLSHFILDAIPHFDWGTWHEGEKDHHLEAKDYILVTCDIILLLIFTLILWDNIRSNIYIIVGMFFAILVDLIFNVPFWKNYTTKIPILKNIQRVHEMFHFQLKMKYWYWGVLTQIFIVILSLIVIFK